MAMKKPAKTEPAKKAPAKKTPAKQEPRILGRAELVAAISENLQKTYPDINLSKEKLAKLSKLVEDTILSIVEKGDKVRIIGFGTFERKDVPAHEGRNPSDGKIIQIAEKKKFQFRTHVTF